MVFRYLHALVTRELRLSRRFFESKCWLNLSTPIMSSSWLVEEHYEICPSLGKKTHSVWTQLVLKNTSGIVLQNIVSLSNLKPAGSSNRTKTSLMPLLDKKDLSFRIIKWLISIRSKLCEISALDSWSTTSLRDLGSPFWFYPDAWLNVYLFSVTLLNKSPNSISIM